MAQLCSLLAPLRTAARIRQDRKDDAEQGNHDKGVQLIGQVQGLIDDVPTVAELFSRLQQEARDCRDRLPQW